jgi:hypothetical protein
VAKIGRPTVLPDRPMTVAERVRRHRYLRGWIDAQLNRMKKKYRRGPVQHNWNRNAPPDVLGNELAFAMFDLATHKANWERWNEIDRNVREALAGLEREFPDSLLIR